MAYLDDLQISVNNITTSSQNIEFVILATQITTASNNRCLTVPDVNSLPLLTTGTNYPQGQIIFVESINVPVISTDNSWIGLDGRTLRKDSTDNQIFSWGDNTFGFLGNGNIVTVCSPVREFSNSSNWITIDRSAGINDNRMLFTWGRNLYGQLGDGTITTRCSPVREFCSATDWCQICRGINETAAIKTSGQLWAWGRNSFGALGIGSSITIGRCSPVREFCSATDWCQVSVGWANMAAIKTSGQLWTWGSNNCGALGIGNSVTLGRCSPVREFCSATDWCQVSVGENCTMAGIKTSGELWLWGTSGTYGSLGIGSTVTICSPVREFCSATDWCQVKTGSNTAAIKTSGQIWTWGGNGFSQLGIGITATLGRCSPVREFCSATNWCQVTNGCASVLAVKTNGEIWGWGRNICGQLGNGVTFNNACPVREYYNLNTWKCVITGACITTALKIN